MDLRQYHADSLGLPINNTYKRIIPNKYKWLKKSINKKWIKDFKGIDSWF